MIRKSTAALALAFALSAGAAFAQGLPSNVKQTPDGFTDAAGKPLYTFAMDTMKGMSHCNGACETNWPPLIAPPDAKPMGDWTLVPRGNGVMQWAYKDKPLYTYAKDTAGQPATGVSNNWPRAK